MCSLRAYLSAIKGRRLFPCQQVWISIAAFISREFTSALLNKTQHFSYQALVGRRIGRRRAFIYLVSYIIISRVSPMGSTLFYHLFKKFSFTIFLKESPCGKWRVGSSEIKKKNSFRNQSSSSTRQLAQVSLTVIVTVFIIFFPGLMGSMFDEPSLSFCTVQKGFQFDNFKGPQISVD